ncbi:MAG: hypothetical protein ACREDR_00165 [Blastocatellia bacterium]
MFGDELTLELRSGLEVAGKLRNRLIQAVKSYFESGRAVYLRSPIADRLTDIGIICLDCNDPEWRESLSVPSGPMTYEAAVWWASRKRAGDVIVKQFMTRDARCASCGGEYFVHGAFFSRPEQLHRAEQLGINRRIETRQKLAIAVANFRGSVGGHG